MYKYFITGNELIDVTESKDVDKGIAQFCKSNYVCLDNREVDRVVISKRKIDFAAIKDRIEEE